MLGAVNIKKESQGVVVDQNDSLLNTTEPASIPQNSLSQNVQYMIVPQNNTTQNTPCMFVPQNNGTQNVQYMFVPQNNSTQNMQYMFVPQSIERRLVAQPDGTQSYQYVFIPQKNVTQNVQYQFVFAPANNQSVNCSNLPKDKIHDSVNNTAVPLLAVPSLPDSSINCNGLTGSVLSSGIMKKDMVTYKHNAKDRICNSILKNKPVRIRENKSDPVPVALIQATSKHIVIHKNDELVKEKCGVVKTINSKLLSATNEKKSSLPEKEKSTLCKTEIKSEPGLIKTENSEHYNIIKNTVTEKMLELNCVIEEAGADEDPLPQNYNETSKVHQWNNTGDSSSCQTKQYIKHSLNNQFSDVWGYLNESDSVYQYTSIFPVKRKMEKQYGETSKKGRGRPKKVLTEEEMFALELKVKRKPGRPKRVLTKEEEEKLKNKVKRPKGRPRKVKTEEEIVAEIKEEEKMKRPKGRPSTGKTQVPSKFTVEQKNALEELFRKKRRPTVESLRQLANDLKVGFRSVACWFGRRRTRKKLPESSVKYLNKIEDVEMMEHEDSVSMKQETVSESQENDNQKMEHKNSQSTEQENIARSDANKMNLSKESEDSLSQDILVEAVTGRMEDTADKAQVNEEPQHDSSVCTEKKEASLQSSDKCEAKFSIGTEKELEVGLRSMTEDIAGKPSVEAENQDKLQDVVSQAVEEVKDNSQTADNDATVETASNSVQDVIVAAQSEGKTVELAEKKENEENLQCEDQLIMKEKNCSESSENTQDFGFAVQSAAEDMAVFRLNEEQKKKLEEAFTVTMFPDRHEYCKLSDELQVPKKAISDWFHHRRIKQQRNIGSFVSSSAIMSENTESLNKIMVEETHDSDSKDSNESYSAMKSCCDINKMNNEMPL